MIIIDDFKKNDLRIAKIIFAERVENSEKLIKLEISLGKESESAVADTFTRESIPGESQEEWRQIIAGIGKAYAPEELVGKEIVIVANLEPKIVKGLESQGMLLAADCESNPVLLIPEKSVPPGTQIR